MAELLEVTGMVIAAGPIGEYDKRVVLLTKELGKISAFARGARKPGNALMAHARALPSEPSQSIREEAHIRSRRP